MIKGTEILSAESLDDLEFVDFKSVFEVFLHLVFKRYLHVTLSLGFFLIFIPFFLFNVIGATVFYTVLIPISIIVIYASRFTKVAERWFMGNFAETKGLKYETSAPISTVDGKIFEIGRKRSIKNVITGIYKKHPFRLFHYSYTRKHGKHDENYDSTRAIMPFTVMEIIFDDIRFPYIALQSRKMPKFTTLKSNEREISLEDDLNNHFRLYCTDNYQIETLQIFSIEFLSFLRDTASEFSIEFAKNKIYIYDDKFIHNKEDLNEIFEVSKRISDSIGGLVRRLSGDFDVMHERFALKR